MAEPRLTEFLLKLATDADFLAVYDNATDPERDLILQAYGVVDVEARSAVIARDDATITKKILAELPSSSKNRGGNHFTVQIMVELPAAVK